MAANNLSASESISLMWLKDPSIYLVLSALVVLWTGIFGYYSAKILGVEYFPVKTMLINMTGEALLFSIFGVLAHNKLLIQNASGNYVHASAAAMIGLIAGFLMKKYLLNQRREFL